MNGNGKRRKEIEKKSKLYVIKRSIKKKNLQTHAQRGWKYYEDDEGKKIRNNKKSRENMKCEGCCRVWVK